MSSGTSDQDPLALARHYLEIGNARRAVAELDSGGGAAIEDEEFWSIRAQALFELDRWSEAAEAAKRGLADDPDDVMLLDILALCEFQLDHNVEADERIRAALELWPDHPTLLVHRALILAHLKRFDEAERLIAQAREIEPEASEVLLTSAQVAALRGDRARARDYADELLAVAPESELSHMIRGAADLQSARFKQAVRHLEEAARLNPEHPRVGDALREARVGAHPVLAPVRPILRFGRFRSWLVYLTLAAVLAAARLHTLRYVVAGIWATIVILSWVAPPVLRRWYRRKGHV